MEAYCWSWGEGEEATSRLLAVSTKRGALLLPLPCCCYGRVPVLAGGRRACRCRVAALLRGARLEQRKSSSWGPPSAGKGTRNCRNCRNMQTQEHNLWHA